MPLQIRSFRRSWVLVAPVFAVALTGCSVMSSLRPDFSATPKEPTEANAANATAAVDPRRFQGPDYCPELRILEGADINRTYERGRQDDADHVIWQASFSKTARECLYERDNSLTLKVGLSGRVIAGPKGGAGTVSVPVKVALVKFQEAVITTQPYTFDVAIPASGSATFTEVRELVVSQLGGSRDYIVYVGFDVGEWDLLAGTAVAKVETEPAPPPPAAVPPPPPPQQPQQAQPQKQPNVLPVPSGGFVLPGG